MDKASDPSGLARDDLSALAWVHGELRRSLDTAHKALRRYLKEAETIGGSEIDAVDPAILRSARTQLHQGVGALELVGLPAVADVLRSSELAVQRMIAKPAIIDAAAIETVEHVSFALLDFLARQLAGKPVSPVALFPQYRAALQLAGADRVHPADLWKIDWQWLELPPDPAATPRAADDDARGELETLVLALMRDSGRDPAGGPLTRMSNLCADLGADARLRKGSRKLATFWQLAAAVFEAQAAGLIASDNFTKRFASRLLAQLRLSVHGQPETSDRLAQDLLFFCSHARPPAPGQHVPRLAAVRQGWHLQEHPTSDYDTPRLGRFDPALLALARKRVAAARDSWSAAAGGEQHRIGSLPEQFTLVGESLTRLFPSGDVLAAALQATVQQTVAANTAPPPALAMEVATGILYLDASLEDGEFDQPELAERIQRLAHRIDEVRGGADPQPLDLWMEELYRRVSDRQTMGSVVQELRASLSEIEKQIDQYFRHPAERQVLIPVPAQLSAMRGVLSVLDLPHASQAVIHMRDDVDALAQTEVDPQRAIQAGTFDRLADNLGALSFLIDMLSVQPALAKSLFRFDPEFGCLSAVMGQSERVSAFAALDEEPVSVFAEPPTIEFPVRELAQAAAAAEAAAAPPEPPPAPVPPPTPTPLGGTGLEEDAEMREIFIEEAREVVTDARAALERLADAPENAGDMTTVRRAFHTLKGSSRMVGLRDFGEAAWACEQLYNARLALAPRMDGPLRILTGEALSYFADWAEAIAANRNDGHNPAAVAKAADTLRLEGTRLAIEAPIQMLAPAPDAALAAPPASPEPELPNLVLDLAPEPEPEPATLAAAGDEPTLVLSVPDAAALLPPAVADEPAFELSLSAFESEGPGEQEPPLDLGADFALPTLADRVSDLPSAADLELGLPAPVEAAAAAEALSFSFDLGEPAAEAPPAPADAAPLPEVTQALPPRADDTLPPEASYEVTQLLPPLPQVPTPAGEALEIDLADLGDLFGSAPEPAAPTEPADAAPAEAGPQDILDLGAEAPEGGADIALDIDGAAAPQPDFALDFDLAATPSEVEATLVLPAFAPAPAEAEAPPAAAAEPDLLLEPDLPFEPAPEPVAEASDALQAAEPAPVEEEPVRVIGPLRISIPLFNIFLNEADEQSRRLVTELAEWAVEYERHPVPESCSALAHSLAGNCGTVGYTELSVLARSLEHALVRSHNAGHGREGEGRLFGEAADEIRRLLHQFAAGFLHGVDPELTARLAEHERLPVPPIAEYAAALDALEDLAPEGWLPAEAVAAAAQPEEAAAAAMAAQAEADDIDAVDAIDTDLFPIFEEEAEELLPQLQSRLRDWLDRPGDASAASACMRTLHTFKGGARLSGAMRLGEMAHRLETAIEQLSQRDDVELLDIEPLVARADGMSMAFEKLRGRAAPAAPPVAAPVPTPPPVLAAPAQPLLLDELSLRAANEPVLDQDLPADAPDALEQALADAQAQPEAAAGHASDAAAEPAAETSPPQPAAAVDALAVDWSRFPPAAAGAVEAQAERAAAGAQAAVRVRAGLLDRMVNQAGEVSITRARIDADVKSMQGSLGDLTDSLERMRRQLRDIELQAETQISSRIEAAKAALQTFDPLEMDRFTRFQELTRFMAESVNDVATLQRSLQRTLQSTEDELAAQARLTRELQDDLLRTRMVEFESASDRLYRTVRQAAKETGKQVRMEIIGGAIEIDRGVLERMTGPFEHLLRNCVAHGIEAPAVRQAAGKEAAGLVSVTVAQAGNEVAVDVADDGAGLDQSRVRARAVERGLIAPDSRISDDELSQLIFMPGFSTAETVTELAGRGVGLDVVRAEVNAMGGRIETHSEAGRGTRFRLLLPLTTAVTQVVMLRCGELQVAVPSTLVEVVRRVPSAEVERGYAEGQIDYSGQHVPFFWLAALLQAGTRGEVAGRNQVVVVIRSASQRVAVHVDEVVGNQEVVVKNVGPQLARLPGLAGVTLLPSGAVALIYNPVALASVYAEQVRERLRLQPAAQAEQAQAQPAPTRTPMVMVVDDSLTVRRVTQRLLSREGYRVVTAKDGLEALERLAEERPVVLLSDIEMPRMDGFDLVRNVRADPRLAGLPVVMISSRIAQKHRDHAAGLGVDHYLGKPYSEEELLSLVARYAGADIQT